MTPASKRWESLVSFIIVSFLSDRTNRTDQTDHSLFWRSELDKVAAAILFPRGFVMAVGHGFVFAIADSVHARGINAEGDEGFAQGQGAALRSEERRVGKEWRCRWAQDR